MGGGGPGGVSNGNLRPVVVPKQTAPVKNDTPAAPPPGKPAVAGTKDDFHTVKSNPPLKPGAYGPSGGFGLPSAHGAISAEEWADPARLMSKLTQYPAGQRDAQSEAACSASNLLGAAMLSGGPDAAAAMLDKVAKGSSQLSASEQQELSGIADRIRNRSATFEDLNRAQVLTYRSANTVATASDLVSEALEPKNAKNLTKSERSKLDAIRNDPSQEAQMDRLLTKALKRPIVTQNGLEQISSERDKTKDVSGLTDDELKSLGSKAVNGSQQALGPSSGPGGGELDSFATVAASLKPGEAATLRVATKADGDPDHYVTLGRRKDGSYYLYNPDPGKGDHTLITGGNPLDEKFKKAIAKYDDRMTTDLGSNNLPPALKYSP